MDLVEYDSKIEFKTLIENYILVLLGIKDNNLKETDTKNKFYNNLISFEGEKIYFVPSLHTASFGYFINTSEKYIDFDLTLANKVLEKLVKVAYNQFNSSNKKQFKYTSIYQCNANYKIAVQEAIVEHLSGKAITEKDGKIINNTLLKLIELLENWSMKTYEGKRMPFGFIVDLVENSQSTTNYLDFLAEEFSATLPDGITSVVILDKFGNIIKYSSLVEDNKFLEYEIKNCLPYRFAQIISENIKENSKRIGVFLLTGGDIMIARNCTVELIKINGQWANFSYTSFINSMSRYSNTKNIDERLLKNVFATALDVSLSHSGGIIAIVNNGGKILDKNYCSILSDCDNLSNNLSNNEIEEILKLNGEKELSIKKRIQKRNVMMSLLNGNTDFSQIDRKLRCELAGLDGATIIEKSGRVICFGAIIQNDKGSSGGGRGAAAKKLSDYGGLAIKISTDGYIEVYIDKDIKYYIK